MRAYCFAIAAALLVIPPGPAPAAPVSAQAATALRPDWPKAFQAELDALRADMQAPGLSAAVALPDGSVRTFTSGEADRERHVAMSSDHKLLAASIGKTVVAATALALAQDGVMGLDEPVAKWLGDTPWFKRLPNASDLTLRRLLDHSSGLPNHADDPRFFADWTRSLAAPDTVPSPEQLVAYVLDKPPLFAAGRGHSYSDTNYLVAGLVMERATGQRFYELAEARVLRPNGLTTIVPSNARAIPGLTAGYLAPKNELGWPARLTMDDGRLRYHPGIEWTGGGFAATPRDLARWIRLEGSGRALPRAYLHDLFVSQPVAPGYRYGLGIEIRDTPFGTAYQHTGAIPGFGSLAAYFPDHDTALVVMVNKYDPSYRSSDWTARLGRVLWEGAR